MRARGFLRQRRAYTFAFLGIFGLLAARVLAQDHPPEHQHMAEAPPARPASNWSWTADANVFVGYNYQSRLFATFSAFESQNWFMLSVSSRVSRMSSARTWSAPRRLVRRRSCLASRRGTTRRS